MATIDDVRALGYTVEENSLVRISGLGREWVIAADDQAMIDELANPVLHAERERLSTPPQALTEGELEREQTLRQRVLAGLDDLTVAAQTWPTLTSAAKDLAMRRAITMLVRLARLVLRRLDEAP